MCQVEIINNQSG